MRTTRKDLEAALRVLARTANYVLLDDHQQYSHAPVNALYITGENAGTWRGNVMTKGGDCPLGQRLSGRGELLVRIQAATKFAEFTKTHYGLGGR